MNARELWQRFRRRKIATWTAAYVAGAAAVFGTLESIGDVFAWQAGVMRAVFFLLLAGLVITVLVAWYHGERGRQGVGAVEALLILGVSGAGLSAAGWSLRSSSVGVESAGARPQGAVESPADPAASTPEALEAFRRGEDALRSRTPAAVIEAIGEYREAYSLAPGMAAALAREAYAYGLFLDWGWTYPGINSDRLLELGMELSARALEMDSVAPEAWLARAYLLQLADPQNPERALSAYSRATALDPANPEAHHQFGQTLMISGRYAEARSAYHAALAIDGERPLTLVALSAIARRIGDTSAAKRWADSAVVLAADAPYAWASRALRDLEDGNFEGAAKDAREALRIDPSYELPARAILGAALWNSDQREEGRRELERSRAALVKPEEPSPTDALYLGAALVSIGRVDEALALIEAARPRARWLWFYLQSPGFDPIRRHPRFRAVVDRAVG